MNPFGYGNIHGKHERKEQRREAFRDGSAFKNKRWPKGRCKNPIHIKTKSDERGGNA